MAAAVQAVACHWHLARHRHPRSDSAVAHCRYLPALAVLLVNSALLPLLIESSVRYQRLKLKSSEAKAKLWLYSLNLPTPYTVDRQSAQSAVCPQLPRLLCPHCVANSPIGYQ